MASYKLSALIKYRQLSTSNSFLWRHQFMFLIIILRHCFFHKFLNLSIRNKKVNYIPFCLETLHLTPGSIVTNPKIHYSFRNRPPFYPEPEYSISGLPISLCTSSLPTILLHALPTSTMHASRSPRFNTSNGRLQCTNLLRLSFLLLWIGSDAGCFRKRVLYRWYVRAAVVIFPLDGAGDLRKY